MLTTIVCFVFLSNPAPDSSPQKISLVYNQASLKSLKNELNHPENIREAACSNLQIAIDAAYDTE